MKILQGIQLSKKLNLFVGFVTYALLTLPLLFAYQKILEGKFWMLDDHVMINAFEETKTLGFIAKLDALLELNGVSYLPDDGRLNPTLSFLYAIRVLVFGIDPSHYFALNFILLMLTSIALFRLLISIRNAISIERLTVFGRIAVVTIVLILFSIPQIISNYVNLGTSELIGPLFLFITLSTLIQRLFLENRTIFNGILLVLSGFFLVGVKENYALIMFFILMSVLIGAYEYSKKDLKVIFLIFSITIFFVTQILFVSQSKGTDVYGKDSSLAFTLLSVSKILVNKYGIAMIAASLILFILIKRYRNNLNSQARILATWPFLIFMSDWLIYRGDIRERYATNAIISILLVFYIIFSIVQVTTKEKNLISVVAIVLCVAVIQHELPTSLVQVHRKILATESFEKGLEQIVISSEKKSSIPVAFVAQSDWDYESIISVGTFLKSKGLRNPLILEVSQEFPANSGTVQIFKDWSNIGIPGLYRPKAEELTAYINCIYSQNDPSKKMNKCMNVIVLKWLP